MKYEDVLIDGKIYERPFVYLPRTVLMNPSQEPIEFHIRNKHERTWLFMFFITL